MYRLRKLFSSAKPATIDDLSDDLIGKIFQHLFHPKYLAACSLVNKRWHSLCSDFKMAGLVVIGDSALRIGDCYSNLQLDEDRDVCGPEWFERSLGRPLLANLKHLTLNIADTAEFDVDQLNCLNELVHLEVNVGASDGTKMHLNLPKLNFLALRFFGESSPLSIDCPQLSALVLIFKQGKHVDTEVKHSETIKKLETDMLGVEFAPFREVEVLATRQMRTICRATLLALPKLKELHYKEDIKYAFDGCSAQQLKLKLGQFMEEASELKGFDFRFVFAGFPLSLANVDRIDLGVRAQDVPESICSEYVYSTNYELLDPDTQLDFVSSLDYARLAYSQYDDPIDYDFLKKFTRVRFVKTSAVVTDYAEDFLDFLWSLGSVRSLCLEEAKLDQSFYDQLPGVTPQLVLLQLREYEISEPSKQAPMFFDFIGQLPHFSRFVTNQQLSYESISSLVGWLGRPSMENFVFQLKEKSFGVTKTPDSSTISVFDGDLQRTVFETSRPDEIRGFFKPMAASDWHSPKVALVRVGRWRRSDGKTAIDSLAIGLVCIFSFLLFRRYFL